MKRITIQTLETYPEFSLILLERDEWESIPDLFPNDKDLLNSLWLEQMRPPASNQNVSMREGYLETKPGVIRMSPGLQYVIYRDLDRQGDPCPIRFFVTDDLFVLVENRSVPIDKVMEWAKRGIICKPMDLARVIGVRILRHHQERLESIEDQMEELEEEILVNPVVKQQGEIIILQRRIIGLKKSLNRHLESFTRLSTIEQGQTSSWQELIAQTQRELENVRQTHELIESLREAYQAAMDNRANEIMKFLTLLATVLLPINLLTGFFGMNFEYMPFADHPYGIYVFGGFSISIIVFVIYYFRKKDWLR